MRAIAALQLEAAMKELKGNKTCPEAIHNARTYIKKVRAVIRLASPAMPRSLRRDLLGQLREGALRLGPIRDSEVRVQTLNLLLETNTLPAEQFASLLGGFTQTANQLRINGIQQIPGILQILGNIRDSIPDWPIDDLEAKDLRHRIRRTYRRGRAILDLCYSTRTPDDFHLWRKQVKQLWYQLRITAPYWPGKGGKLIAAAGMIGHLAGTERDNTLLGAALAAGPSSVASSLLQARIVTPLPFLRKKAMSEGGAFYGPSPNSFVKFLDL